MPDTDSRPEDINSIEQEIAAKEHLLAKLYSTHRLWIIRKLRRLGLHVEDAEDLYQDAIIVLDKKLPSLSKNGREIKGSYIWQIVRRLRANRGRKKGEVISDQAELAELIPQPLSMDTPESYFLKQEEKEQLLIAMQGLGEKCRKVLNYYQQGYNTGAIAREMGWQHAQSAMNTLSTCRQQLRKLIQKIYSAGHE